MRRLTLTEVDRGPRPFRAECEAPADRTVDAIGNMFARRPGAIRTGCRCSAGPIWTASRPAANSTAYWGCWPGWK